MALLGNRVVFFVFFFNQENVHFLFLSATVCRRGKNKCDRAKYFATKTKKSSMYKKDYACSYKTQYIFYAKLYFSYVKLVYQCKVVFFGIFIIWVDIFGDKFMVCLTFHAHTASRSTNFSAPIKNELNPPKMPRNTD